MDYSADLPINTMGRRIRTRLYFTSESHLHTVLNLLRFGGRPILSQNGIDIINGTPELCYLTQIVMRVFEDSRPEMRENPNRFRVEILFSPGATATPFHLDEANRESDPSRLDTAPLQMIGRDSLTCDELEEFFAEAIMAGRADDEDCAESPSVSTLTKAVGLPKYPSKRKEDKLDDGPWPAVYLSCGSARFSAPMLDSPTIAEATMKGSEDSTALRDEEHEAPTENTDRVNQREGDNEEISCSNDTAGDKPDGFGDDESVDTTTSEVVRKVVSRKRCWTFVAVGSFVVGVSCLLLAMQMADDSRHRRSTRRFN